MTMEERHPQQMIARLRTRLLVMCANVNIALHEAVRSLVAGDEHRATSVIDGDCEVNALEQEIDDLALAILIRTQPVACDLRFVIGALRMITDLERIADEAVVIAERVKMVQDESYRDMAAINQPLCLLAEQYVQSSIQAFKEQGAQAAKDLCALHDDITQAEMAVFQAIMERATDSAAPLNPYTAMHSILVCRALSRICRRAVNIAEHTYFICVGENIKHNTFSY